MFTQNLRRTTYCVCVVVSALITMVGRVGHCRVDTSDKIVLVAGGQRNSVDVPAVEAKLNEPFGAEFDLDGNLWILEMASGNRLLKVATNGLLTHIAGRTEKGFSGDGGSALAAQFNGPHNLAIRPDGRVLIADTWNGRIRQVDPKTNHVESLAGYEISLDKAKSEGPYCISLDFSGKKLFVADLQRIHAIDLESGKRSIVAGNGEKGVPVDGSVAANAPLVDPRAVAADRLGNVYILERGGNALRVVNSQGNIRTVVNTLGKKGMSEHHGPAAEAKLNGPKHLCIDRQNRVIIADAENNIVVRYDPQDETVQRIAGTGQAGRQGIGGDPLQCQLARPHGVSIHPTTGELFITDSYNDRILKIEKSK